MYHHPPHRDNVTTPHGRLSVRSRLLRPQPGGENTKSKSIDINTRCCLARSQNCEWKLLALSFLPVRPSVCPQSITGLTVDKFSWNFMFVYFLKIFSENSNFIEIRRITGSLHEDKFILLIISRPVLVRIRNVLNKCYRENQNTNFIHTNFFFSKIAQFMGLLTYLPTYLLHGAESLFRS
jgi:hypothetical protein